MHEMSLYPEEAIGEQIQSIIKYSKAVYDRHLVSAAGGNVSARCPQGILITAGNTSLGEITPDDIVLCSPEGTVLRCPEGKRPSKELHMHLSVYQMRENVNGVIHAHPNYCTAFTAFKKTLPLFTTSAKLKLGCVLTIPAAEPGSMELAKAVDLAVSVQEPSRMAFLMEAHGCLVLGENLMEAFYTAELLEDTAQIALLIDRT